MFGWPVEEAEGDGRGGGEEDVIHADGPSLVQHLPAPVVVDGKPKLDNVEGYILVEAIQDNLKYWVKKLTLLWKWTQT